MSGSARQGFQAPRVKNRAPAAVQITAEQLLREAEGSQAVQFRAPKQRVEDYEELNEYRGRKRKEFEERIRRTRGKIREWQSYASWEASQGEFDRSRSVYERALDVDSRDISLWLSYTEMELKARNVQHARNLFDRAVTFLPRINQLWYKYVYLEELLQNIPGARQVFERWMKWEPDDKAWQAYIKLEERYNELDRASAIYERWVAVRPEPRVWVKWGKFEEERGKLDKAREVFQMALEFFGDEEEQVEKAQAVFSAFAKMETRLKEYDRARVIYKFALSRVSRSKSTALYATYTKFEKQHGDRSGVESTVLGKRRIQYEEELSHDSRDYNTWFDYARLEEDAFRGDLEDGSEPKPEKVREVYERAVAQVPPGGEKRHWRRYIFLWLDYALFEEIETEDIPRARQIYKTAIDLVPHRQFTFAKLWIMLARFEIRQMDLMAARKVLGAAIGICPKEALFKGYIQLELELHEFDRARTLYEKYLEFDPTNCSAWIKYAELEIMLGDVDRVRAIFELATSQAALDMPELLWKSYIDFEFDEGERDRTRALYERLLEKSKHLKIWLAYARFEMAKMSAAGEDDDEGPEEAATAAVGEEGDVEKARVVYERAYAYFKADCQRTEVKDDLETFRKVKAQRAELVLTAWKPFEEEHGSAETLQRLGQINPHKELAWEPSEFGGMEEVWAWKFDDDIQEENPNAFKFLQMARQWKMSSAAKGGAGQMDVEEDEKDDSDEDSDSDKEVGASGEARESRSNGGSESGSET
ncbi:NineTeen Complex (NTC) component [Tulasnella sp. 331]|nr:NineTeen Complex (NTC) component [Tulasnella sp. 331]